MSRPSILLVDTNALTHRSYNGLPKLTTPEGIPTGASFGFLRALFAQLKTGLYTHVVCVYDAGGSNPRKSVSMEYKGNRQRLCDELKTQITSILELLPELGIPTMGMPGYEADDIISTLCLNRSFEAEYTIFTCDRDLLNCLSQNVSVLLFNTSAKKIKKVTVDSFIEENGETHYANFLLVKALSGDSSDNIKGVPGVGVKTAINVIESGGEVIEHPKVKGHGDLVRRNMELVRPIFAEHFSNLPLDEHIVRPPSFGSYCSLMESYHFNSLATEKNYEVLSGI